VKIVWAAALMCLLPALAPVRAADLQSSLDLVVPEPPTPVNVGGEARLVYELHLTNFSADRVMLKTIEVRDAQRGTTVAKFDGADLTALLGHPGPKAGPAEPRVIEPGMRAVSYFWLVVGKGATVPRTITHRVSFDLLQPDTSVSVVTDGGTTTVNTLPPAVLGPPLRGGPWVAVYDPEMSRGHRRMLFAVNGRADIPARFAVDWFKVDPNGKLARGDEAVTANWYGYGTDVLAVANATVIAVRGNMSESTSVSMHHNALQNASGNFVVLDIGSGRYAFYEHLKPGSIKVRAGDHVATGQVIASLGYTGDSTGPHLHFHVADGPSPLAAEGLPYVIRDFEVLGGYGTIAAFAAGRPWKPSPKDPDRRSMQFPLANGVIRFAP
jgi:peptidase M23-like protein